MNAERTRVWTVVSLIFVGCLVALAAQPASAQAVIPEGSIITSAEFTIFAHSNAQGQYVNVYRVTSGWAEAGVTWGSFAESYDPVPIGSFVAVMPPATNVIDVTDLVQDWVDGSYPNYGILLELGPITHVRYYSSEDYVVATRPNLEIEYTDPFGVPGNHVVIQRPAETQGGVADTYIWESRSGANFGNSPSLYTGMYYGRGEKQSLVRFFFTVEPPGPGTGTQGYWKNHPRAWPVSGIEIGGMWYTKRDAIRGMKRPVRGDKTRSMFRQLVAVKLNVEIGNDDSCIDFEIEAADSWMCDHPLGSRVKANSPEWQNEGGFLHYMLNEYNNGRLDCANHRVD